MTIKAFYVVVGLLVAAEARADLIVNGTFTNEEGAASAEGWSTVGNIEANNYYGPNSVRGGTENGVDAWIGQEIEVVSGTTYRITFFAQSNQGPGSNNGLDVHLGEAVVLSNHSNLPMEWTSYEAIFTAGASKQLGFTLFDSHSVVSLTNVSVQAVPEPASITMLGLGLLAIKLRRR